MRVPAFQERDEHQVSRPASPFRHHFAKHRGREVLRGRSEFSIDRNSQTGVPGVAFVSKEAKMMINLPSGKKAYISALTNGNGLNAIFKYTEEMISKLTRRAQNVICVPLVNSSTSSVGVVSFDFDQHLSNVSNNDYLDLLRLTLMHIAKESAQTEIQFLAWLATQIP